MRRYCIGVGLLGVLGKIREYILSQIPFKKTKSNPTQIPETAAHKLCVHSGLSRTGIFVKSCLVWHILWWLLDVHS